MSVRPVGIVRWPYILSPAQQHQVWAEIRRAGSFGRTEGARLSGRNVTKATQQPERSPYHTPAGDASMKAGSCAVEGHGGEKGIVMAGPHAAAGRFLPQQAMTEHGIAQVAHNHS